MKIERNHILVGLGLLALFLLLRWGFSDDSSAPAVPAAQANAVDGAPAAPRQITRRIGGGSARGAASRDSGPVNQVVRLDLAALEGERVERALTRNPWQYARERPVAPPPRPTPRPQPTQTRPVVQPTTTQPTQVEPAKPKPPPIDFRFLGTFGPNKRRIAVFEDNEKVLYNASEGDLIKEKFSVAKIGFESVDVGFVDFPDEPPKRLEVGRQ